MTNKKRRNKYAKILQDLGIDFITAHKAAKKSFKETSQLDLVAADIYISSEYLISQTTGWNDYFHNYGTVTTYKGKSDKIYVFWNYILW